MSQAGSANASAGAALLRVEQMYQADRLTMERHLPGIELMENAGAGAARAISARWPAGRAAVLCGPGNNGGDGFVIARHLKAAGWELRLGLLGKADKLTGDAAEMAKRWDGGVEKLAVDLLDGVDLVVDAIFGAGLTRAVSGVARDLIEAAAARGLAVAAVDVPSGVDGDTGAVLGAAFDAALTVTFFRRKPGHLLLPGRVKCGAVGVVDIGIPAAVLDEIAPDTFANEPALWRGAYPWSRVEGHKYDRGHAVVLSGPAHATGAARLAARAALRAGAGLVSVASPPDALLVNAAHLTAVMNRKVADADAWDALLADKRLNAILLGPGNGVTERTRAYALAALAAGKLTVLDADALTVFQESPGDLFQAITAPCVLTPHDGEFARLFDPAGDRLARARAAAQASGAVVLLKSSDTVIAGPDGRAAINANAPPELATAGAGDVLAGLILGLMAQAMPAFEAACAAAWLHGAAATEVGPGLIAEDLPEALPAVLRRLKGLSLE